MLWTSTWEAPHALSSASYWWKIFFHHLILFFVVFYFLTGNPCHVTVTDLSLVALFFFFLPSFLSHTQRKCTLVLIVISFPDSIFLVLIVYFCYFLFYYSFICFQFNPSILICIYNFSIRSSTFDFFFFSFYLLSRFFLAFNLVLLLWFLSFLLGHFVKKFMVFNFILQIKFMFFFPVIIIIIIINNYNDSSSSSSSNNNNDTNNSSSNATNSDNSLFDIWFAIDWVSLQYQ
jgi:hypothetical protein